MKLLILILATLQLTSQVELFEFNQRAFPGSSAVYGDTIVTNYQSENLFISYDNGNNWDTLNVNLDLSCREIIKKGDILFLLSGNGALLKLNLKTKVIEDIAPYFDEYPSMNAETTMLIKDELIIIGKEKGTIEISQNAGETWEERKVYHGEISRITEHTNKIYLVLETSYKDHTVAKYNIKTNEITNISRFYSYVYQLKSIDNKLFICGSQGLIAYTDNEGKSWKHFNTKLPWSISNLKLYNGDLYAMGGFDETYIFKIDLNNGSISNPKMILESGSYIMDIANENLFIWRRKPDKLLAFDLEEIMK
jgi:hypothetical protein